MSKFCTKCGSKIEECKCNIKEAKYEEITSKEIKKDIKKYTIDFLAKPLDTMDEFLKNKNNDLSYIFLLLSSFIVSILLIEFRYIDLVFNYSSIPYFRYFILYATYIFISYIVFAFITSLISKYVFKEEIEYNKIIKVVGLSSLIITYAGLLIVISYIYSVLAIVLFILSIIMFSILFNYGLSKISHINKNKIPYLYILSIIVLLILNYIIR